MSREISNFLSISTSSRFLVVSACTASKRFNLDDQLTEKELDKPAIRNRAEKRLSNYLLPAAEMYTGQGHKYVREAIYALRKHNFTVSHSIVSAGYGLLNEKDLIAPYNVSFSGAAKTWIRDRGQRLKLRQYLVETAKFYDKVVLILGREYFEAIGLPMPVELMPPILAYVAPSLVNKIGTKIIAVPIGQTERHTIGAYSSSAKEKYFLTDVSKVIQR